MILDTCFLIDLQRELRDGKARGAVTFLRMFALEFPKISLVTWMEFAEGYPSEREADCRKFLTNFPLLTPDPEVAWRASRIQRDLRAAGQTIGDHDAWIAAAALAQNCPVVTQNTRHFEGVPGLSLKTYRTGV